MRRNSAEPRTLPSLAARAQLGDGRALEELLRRLQGPLAEHVRGIVRDDDAAADVLQDTLIIISRRLGSVRDIAWVRAWAYRVATREAVRAVGKARRHAGDPLGDAEGVLAPGAEPPAVDEELLAELPAKLAEVPAGAQTVLRLHYLQSLSQQEVAEALEIPLGTVKSRLAYGLQCLRRAWGST